MFPRYNIIIYFIGGSKAIASLLLFLSRASQQNTYFPTNQ